MDREDLLAIRQALQDAPQVDAGRIDVGVSSDGTAVTLVGAVADAEAAAAELIASGYADRVLNELRIDPGLREGISRSVEIEPALPAEGEVLVGSTDMLAGPEPEAMTDQLEALAESQPWDPPDEPWLPPTPESAGTVSLGDGELPGDDEPIPGASTGPEYPGVGDPLSGVPAVETGAKGADTAVADPARLLSGSDAGTGGVERGPESRDDEAIREDLPEDFPPHVEP
jgi:hypothetical protein